MTSEEYIKSISADLDKLGLPAPLNRAQVVGMLRGAYERGQADASKPQTPSSPRPSVQETHPITPTEVAPKPVAPVVVNRPAPVAPAVVPQTTG